MKKIFRSVIPILAGLCFLLPVHALSADSAILMEASSGEILIDVNGHTRMPMASTTKIMTAIVALERSSLSDSVTIPEKAVGIEGSSLYLKTGEVLTIEQLLYGLLLESANDVATAIAIHIAGDPVSFAELMNQTAHRLGLTDTHFTNPHGLYDPEHYTTAYDLAILTRYALSQPDFAKIVSTYKTTIPLNCDEGIRVLVNHNKMLKNYPGAIGVKTGYTKRCGRCLVSAAERNHVRLIAVTLSDPNDWQDHTSMLDYGFSCYSSVTLAEPESFEVQIPCLGGIESMVLAKNYESLSHVMPANHQPIVATIETNRYLCAPIQCGDIVGQVIFRCDGQQIGALNLYAETSVSTIPRKSSIRERISHFFTAENNSYEIAEIFFDVRRIIPSCG